MKKRLIQLSSQLHRVSIAMGNALARMYRFCYRIQFKGIGVSLIPGLLTCNISFRAGGSGRAYYSHSLTCPTRHNRYGLLPCLRGQPLAVSIMPVPLWGSALILNGGDDNERGRKTENY